ncbi:acetate kinase [Hahella sp. SMD15-11]|uniref:Acetate kinase n=1 Tax=Thermohahella caldifontis TaxID=3142973 RepID=A0AB39UYP0_9GAMM
MSPTLVWVMNCGSSSVKFQLTDPDTGAAVCKGLAERLGTTDAQLTLDLPGGRQVHPVKPGSAEQAIRMIIARLSAEQGLLDRVSAIGHRVVHGGETFTRPTRLDAGVLQQIRDCCSLAPLHNPANLQGIELMQAAFPGLPQVAVFDTAFHQTLPAHAFLYALPWGLYSDHRIRRYGFHGSSHQFITEETARRLGKPVSEVSLVSVHLGNGCSATAVQSGQSVDTTMGLTPLEGLVMGTRSGSLDPGILLHLQRQLGYSVEDVDRLLNKESGLKGISGLSHDMRTLTEAAEAGHERAQLAIEIFCYQAAKQIAGLMLAASPLDALVFTGGIGENAAGIRARILGWLAPLGYELDPGLNDNAGRSTQGRITKANCPLALVVPTNEEWLIARETRNLLQEEAQA